MRKIAALATGVLVGATAIALAQGVNLLSEHELPQQAISIDAMKQKIDALGYDVRRLKVDDAAFKVEIVDRQSGGLVKASFDRATGELVRAKLDSRRRGAEAEGRDHRHLCPA
jgi:hypothetical protein